MNCNINKKEECRRLWKEVFGDSDEFIASFINHFYNEENTLLSYKDTTLLIRLYAYLQKISELY